MSQSEPHNPWQTHSSRLVYENTWIQVVEHQVTNPRGGPGIYGVVNFAHRAVGVIPIDDEDHTWLVGQYRYALKTYEWEIVEGGSKSGEDLVDSARRELLEEAGIVAGSYELILGGLQTSNSVCNEVAFIYVARDLSFVPAEPEETEEIAIRRVPVDEACAMVERGEIRDLMSVAGLLRLKLMRQKASRSTP